LRWALRPASGVCWVGHQSLYKFAASLAFFGNSRFGNILPVYAVIMLFTPLLVRLRLRYGVRFVVFCLADEYA
jgi:hypothetical protein